MLKPSSALFKFLMVLMSLWAIAGCSALPLPDRFLGQEPINVNLSIDAIEATETAGIYRVAGRTNLPESTELTLSAIRRLDTTEAASFNLEPSYTILDRQLTTVHQGAWEATLNLWRVAPSGQYQEAWQLDSSLGITPRPSETVLFQATLEPTQQTDSLETALKRSQVQLRGERVRFTSDGEFYIYASRDRAIALPTGRTTPPAPVQSANSAPVTRSAEPSPPPLTLDATSAPLSPSEMLR